MVVDPVRRRTPRRSTADSSSPTDHAGRLRRCRTRQHRRRHPGKKCRPHSSGRSPACGLALPKMTGVVRVAWFRFWATFRPRLGAYLALGLLLGLIGGLWLGAAAGGRSTPTCDTSLLWDTKP